MSGLSTQEQDILLLQALCKYRPIGPHRNWNFIALFKHVSTLNMTAKQVSGYRLIRQIHERIASFYQIQAFDDFELEQTDLRMLPFDKINDFELPDSSDYEDIIIEKRKRSPSHPPSTPSTSRSTTLSPVDKRKRRSTKPTTSNTADVTMRRTRSSGVKGRKK